MSGGVLLVSLCGAEEKGPERVWEGSLLAGHARACPGNDNLSPGHACVSRQFPYFLGLANPLGRQPKESSRNAISSAVSTSSRDRPDRQQ